MDNNGKEDLTTNSFQEKIMDWFDQRGVISELRSHLRHRMVTAFQNYSSPSHQNSSGRFEAETPISPALQALLLLVAEFLAQQEYHYTVSILVAEVPLLATFPKFSAHVSHLSDSQTPLSNKDLPRYLKKDVLIVAFDALKEILETLGIESNSESCHHIMRLYMDSSPQESLLACILTALPAVANDHSDSQQTVLEKQPENLTFYIEEIRLLLLRSQLHKNQINQLEDVLRRFYAAATSKARQEERASCLQEAEANNQQLRIWENAARQRQREAEMELEASKKQLKSVTAQLQVQHDDLLSRLHRVQKHAEEIRNREERVEATKFENEQFRKQLEARSELLAAQQIRLEEKYRSLREERDTLLTLRAQLESASQREKTYISSINDQNEVCTNLKSELEKTRQELNEVRVQLKANLQAKAPIAVEPCRGAEKEVASRYTQTEMEEPNSGSTSDGEPGPSSSSSDIGPPVTPNKKPGDRQSGLGTVNLLRHLRQENAELQERNVQLQRRLEEVTEQAAQWASSPARLAEPVVPRPPAPPPPPPLPPPLLRRTARSCELGAGEELNHPPVRQTSRDHTLHLHGREWKRTPPKQLLVHVDPSDYPSSDESISEEVLRETGRRLRHLDAESELIDRRRKELKESALTGTASYMFIPTANTSTVPPPPVVRPYEPGCVTSRLSLLNPPKVASTLNFGLNDSTLRRYSQVTWPDVQGTSTPIRSLDSPLRRGVRSYLSFSSQRSLLADGARNADEHSPNARRSTERDAYFRLDTALDNIKLVREDIKRCPDRNEAKPSEENETFYASQPNDESNVFGASNELDNPAFIRDRVMAALRASTGKVAGLNTPPAAIVSSERETPKSSDRLPSERRISSCVPKLPLAPVVPKQNEESPKDSTLNEIPTPVSSPNLSGQAQNVGNVLLNVGKRTSGNGSSSKESRLSRAASMEESDKNSKRDGKDPNSWGKTVDTTLKRNDESQNDARNEEKNDRVQIKHSIPTAEVESFAANVAQPAIGFKDEESILAKGSSSSANSVISAGSVDDVLKDDSW